MEGRAQPALPAPLAQQELLERYQPVRNQSAPDLLPPWWMLPAQRGQPLERLPLLCT